MGKILVLIYILVVVFFIRIFYLNVICKKIVSNRSLLKEVGAFFINFSLILRYMMWENSNEEKTEDRQFLSVMLKKMEEIAVGIIGTVLILIVSLIIATILAWYLGENNFLLLFVVFGAGMIETVKLVYNYEEKVTKLIQSIHDVNRYFRKNKKMFDEKYKLDKRIIHGIIVAGALWISVNCIVNVTRPLVREEKAGILLVAAAVIWGIVNQWRGKRLEKEKYQKAKKEISLEGNRIELLADDIVRMCNLLGICDIEISETSGMGTIAKAWWKKNEKSQIMLDGELVKRMEKQGDPQDVPIYIKLILAHESIHIYYKEPQSIINSIRKAALLSVGMWVLGVCIFLSGIAVNFLLFIPGLVLIMTSFLYDYICCDQRYWLQLQEIRADRKGIVLSGLPREKVLFINRVLYDLEQDRQKVESVLYRFYVETAYSQGHIKIKRRQKALQLERNWGIYYYFWLFMEILKGKLKGEGWYGN